MPFDQLYTIVDKLFKQLEEKLISKDFSLKEADQEAIQISEFITSCGWSIEDFNRKMILSAYSKGLN